jgi:hypothetical protein
VVLIDDDDDEEDDAETYTDRFDQITYQKKWSKWAVGDAKKEMPNIRFY